MILRLVQIQTSTTEAYQYFSKDVKDNLRLMDTRLMATFPKDFVSRVVNEESDVVSLDLNRKLISNKWQLQLKSSQVG